MSKKLLEDMVKTKYVRQEAQADQKITPKHIRSEEGGKPRYTLWFVAGASLVVLFFALSYLFSKAEVTVNPKVQDLVLNKNLSATREGGADALTFDLVVISGEENKVLKGTEDKEISQKAEGVAVIYNTFSSAPQRLDIDTRLEGSNGKLYKTKTSTVVPGTTAEGKPGSVEVKIYGSVAGQEYNSTPLDFKIFGFKGTPKYTKFYGRSKGSLTGGIKGKFPSVPEIEKQNAAKEMQATLLAKLLKNATDQVPTGFILFKDAVYLDADQGEIDTSSSNDNMLAMKMKGTLYGLLFNEDELAKKIAKDNIEKYDGSNIYIPNIRDLAFSLSGKDNISLSDAKNINFNLSGPVKIVWKFDTNNLITDLLGKSKSDFNKISLKYPNISSAQLILSPIWKTSIPDNSKNIKVIVNYPN